MNKLKKFLRLGISLLFVSVIYILLLMLFNYTGLLKLKTIIKLNFIIVALISFVFGIINGKVSDKKGYIEGLKQGGIIVLILLLFNLIFIRNFSLNIFIYYLIIIISSTFGSMIGINLKKK